jgi:hypothetical protein
MDPVLQDLFVDHLFSNHFKSTPDDKSPGLKIKIS